MCPHSTCIHKIPGKGEVHSNCAIGRNQMSALSV